MIEWVKLKESYFDLAEGYSMLGMYEDAMVEVEKILANEPNEPRALQLKGELFIRLNKFNLAEAQFQKLIRAYSDNPHLYVYLAYILRRTQGIDAAIKAMGIALKLNPDIPVANYNLACYHSVKNDIENALKYLKKALDLNHNYADAAKTDEDFALIRDNPLFVTLINDKKSQKNQEN